jgi:hypothetical protein
MNLVKRNSIASWLRSVVLVLITLTFSVGCNNEGHHPGYAENGKPSSGNTSKTVQDSCITPNSGCDCSVEGESINCGNVVETYENYVTCSKGTRVCENGKWGDCIGESSEQKTLQSVTQRLPRSVPKRSVLTLGSTSAGCDNPCDPMCNRVADSPGNFNAGVGFVNDTTGLSLERAVLVGCDALTITPASTTATVTQILPSVSAVPIKLTAKLTPSCMVSPFPVSWTVDRFDIATVTGTNDTNGEFSVLHAITGDVTVTAYAAGLSATTKIRVIVNTVQSTSAAPNELATSTQIGKFTGSGTAATRVTWLYPYASTYFPIGLLAPVIQYSFNTESSGGATKVSLRYPENATAATATFNYSLIVKEANVVSKNAPAYRPANTTDPQVVMPQIAWQAFEQSARGNNASLVIQRLRSDGTTLENETFRSIRIVDGQLKGTVFYNSYSSQMGGANTGAVLAIRPGASSPVLAVQPSGKCTVCHTINTEGTRLIVAGARTTTSVQFDNSRRFDVSDSTLWPSPTVLNNYDSSTGTDTVNIQGDKFNFGGPWKDGSLYMTHGGKTSYAGDANWHAPPDYSRLYDPNSPATAKTVTNFNNISAITPKFSLDGKKLAFSFWGASGSTLPQTPSGTLSADSTGKSLVVVDFGCSTSSCTNTSTGWKVTNARNVTPGVTHKVGWPTFTPAGDAVLYQRQFGSAKAFLTTWSTSDLNTIGGALAEIWMSNIPPDKSTAAIPTELRALNGLNAAGTASYLPVTPASPTPSYHSTNATFTINQSDNCNNSATVSGVNDYQLNYLPWMAPVEAGGLNWVVFTSRRMYGNIADDDPWDAEPGPTACNGWTCTCTSGNPPTKKLWIAALEKTFTPGTDPSHPAFYLPGQELMAGNSDGYWVNSQCSTLGSTCATSDDCCGGTGTSPTTRCAASTNTCQNISACAAPGASCTATSDCCTGLICGGAKTCVNPLFYATKTYQREYIASCPTGTQVVWRFFEWQATIPASSSIDLYVQTKVTATDAYAPATPVLMASISTTTATNVWAHGALTADDALKLASPSVGSQAYLLVTMTFKPDSTATLSPVLTNWQQNYDCLDAE